MIKSLSQTLSTNSAAGPIKASDVTDYMNRVADFRDRIAVLAVTPGLPDYAIAQKAQPGLDLVAEYQAALAQIDGTRSWITTNFPKDGSGNQLAAKFDAAGGIQYLQQRIAGGSQNATRIADFKHRMIPAQR